MCIIRLMWAWIFSFITGTGIALTGVSGSYPPVTTDRGVLSPSGRSLVSCADYRPITGAFLPDTNACPTERSEEIGGHGSANNTGTDMNGEWATAKVTTGESSVVLDTA